MSQVSATRFINRGANPFAPMVKNRNKALTTSGKSKYDKLVDRAQAIKEDADIVTAIESLKARLGGKYKQEHFGRLEWLDHELIDLNVDIQRLSETPHIAKHILTLFDPRIMQPLNVIYIKETGRYSAWEGQQSGTAFALMMMFGLIEPGTPIQCKVVDDDLTVPGSTLVGEAVGNYGFRCINGNGRKTPDLFYTYRSMVNGVRLYGSSLDEDVHSNEVQLILEQNNMFPAPAIEAKGTKATPGMVSYISGILGISNYDKDKTIFDVCKQDLNWALAWHNRYFSSEKGVDGGFILTFGRLHREARERDFVITSELEADLYRHMLGRYGSPSGFHADCKTRLKNWQIANNLKTSWSDSCLLPIFIMDYITDGGQYAVPEVHGMVTYAGI